MKMSSIFAIIFSIILSSLNLNAQIGIDFFSGFKNNMYGINYTYTNIKSNHLNGAKNSISLKFGRFKTKLPYLDKLCKQSNSNNKYEQIDSIIKKNNDTITINNDTITINYMIVDEPIIKEKSPNNIQKKIERIVSNKVDSTIYTTKIFTKKDNKETISFSASFGYNFIDLKRYNFGDDYPKQSIHIEGFSIGLFTHPFSDFEIIKNCVKTGFTMGVQMGFPKISKITIDSIDNVRKGFVMESQSSYSFEFCTGIYIELFDTIHLFGQYGYNHLVFDKFKPRKRDMNLINQNLTFGISVDFYSEK